MTAMIKSIEAALHSKTITREEGKILSKLIYISDISSYRKRLMLIEIAQHTIK